MKRGSGLLLHLLLLVGAGAALADPGAPTERPALQCRGGRVVTGPDNGWSPFSTCPQGYAVTGIQRLDLKGAHGLKTLHVNDLQCDQRGCRAWCVGSPCTVRARCCR